MLDSEYDNQLLKSILLRIKLFCHSGRQSSSWILITFCMGLNSYAN